MRTRSEKIAVLGLGYVGCVSAACLAKLGHRVVGVDLNSAKVDQINAGRAPFFEPGLEELLREMRAAGRLSATAAAAAALADSDIVIIAVGTPSTPDGDQSSEQIERVCEQIARSLPDRSRELIVVVRSTVFPGTCERLQAAQLDSDRAVVVSHPEFLREGSAIRDFLEPSLLVVGGEPAARKRVADLYSSLDVEPNLVDLRTAEMIKYACNAFHAVKIAFANEIGALSAAQGVQAGEVMETLCRDRVLNVSPAYLKPGFAFGGSCLPKDLRAIENRAARLDLRLPLLANVLASNREHIERAVARVLKLPGRLAVYGLTFKENTDDLRESPVVALVERLIGAGREVRIYDPTISLETIYGANEGFLIEHIPQISKLLDRRLEDCLEWAENILIAQKPSPADAQAIRRSNLPALNLIGGNPLGTRL